MLGPGNADFEEVIGQELCAVLLELGLQSVSGVGLELGVPVLGSRHWSKGWLRDLRGGLCVIDKNKRGV